MKKILIVSGHPDLKDSVANKTILDTIEQQYDNVVIDRLDSAYPDFNIDVLAEQAKLAEADIIVFQFPLFWYSAPSLLHRWIEKTFIHGFSHGANGDKLKDKPLVLSFTSGSQASAYNKQTGNGFEIEEFLPCFQALCALTKMKYSGYVFTGGVSYGNRTTPELIENQKTICIEHAKRLMDKLAKL